MNRERILEIVAVVLIIVLGYVLHDKVVRLNTITEQNNTYHKIVTCIISVEPNRRTEAYVNSCYKEGQENTGVQIERLGL